MHGQATTSGFFLSLVLVVSETDTDRDNCWAPLSLGLDSISHPLGFSYDNLWLFCIVIDEQFVTFGVTKLQSDTLSTVSLESGNQSTPRTGTSPGTGTGTFGYTVDQVSLFVAHIKWIKIVMLFVPYICTGSCKLCIYLYHTLFKYLWKLCEIVVLRKCHYTSLASRLYGGRASFLLHAPLLYVDVINWDSPSSEGADHFYKISLHVISRFYNKWLI